MHQSDSEVYLKLVIIRNLYTFYMVQKSSGYSQYDSEFV